MPNRLKATWPLLLFLAFLWLAPLSNCLATSVGYQKVRVREAVAHVVTVDLRNPEVFVTIGLASEGVGCAESFRSMLRRTQPAAALTGTFFCTRSLKPVGDLVIGGVLVHRGCVGDGLAINADNQARIVPFEVGRASNWRSFETVVCSGPRLVSAGVARVNARSEGFTEPGLFGRHLRSAVGITAAGKLLLVSTATPVTLSHLGDMMRALGSLDAVGLDGGTSTALYCNGRVIVEPGRKLTNLLLVYTGQQGRAEMARQRAKQRVVAAIGAGRLACAEPVSVVAHYPSRPLAALREGRAPIQNPLVVLEHPADLGAPSHRPQTSDNGKRVC